MDAGMPDSYVFIQQDSLVFEQQKDVLLEAAITMFETMGFTKTELLEVVEEGNENAIIIGAWLCMCVEHDATIATRAITGNKYIDCALSVTGLDLATTVREAAKNGLTKAVAKKMLKQAVKVALGTTGATFITLGLWGLCLGGIG